MPQALRYPYESDRYRHAHTRYRTARAPSRSHGEGAGTRVSDVRAPATCPRLNASSPISVCASPNATTIVSTCAALPRRRSVISCARQRRARFVGFGLTVATRADLQKLAALPGASPIESLDAPGGGEAVRLTDPSGFEVHAVFGQRATQALGRRAPIACNGPDAPTRVNETQRLAVAPPEIVKLGHVVIEVADFQATCGWYTRHFGFIPSDVQVFADGSPAVTFMRLDLGAEPADHHTLAIAQGFAAKYSHSAFEVVDADAVGMGAARIARSRLDACLGHRQAHPRQPDLRLLAGLRTATSTSTTATATASPPTCPPASTRCRAKRCRNGGRRCPAASRSRRCRLQRSRPSRATCGAVPI